MVQKREGEKLVVEVLIGKRNAKCMASKKFLEQNDGVRKN